MRLLFVGQGALLGLALAECLMSLIASLLERAHQSARRQRDQRALTKRINGGYNGLDDRLQRYVRAKQFIQG